MELANSMYLRVGNVNRHIERSSKYKILIFETFMFRNKFANLFSYFANIFAKKTILQRNRKHAVFCVEKKYYVTILRKIANISFFSEISH